MATLEAAKGLVVLLTGCGLFALVHQDVQHFAETVVRHAHLNPASHTPRIFLEYAGKVDDARLLQPAAAALAYAGVRMTEAYGLWFERAQVLQVDLLGAFFFIKHAFLHMRPGGAIVNVSSVHALETEPHVAPYAAAKAALLSLTRSAALEGMGKAIRVNAVVPGAIDTPMLWNNPQVQSCAERIDPGEVGKPEELAAAIAFLASDEASFVQGAALVVDGGRLCRL